MVPVFGRALILPASISSRIRKLRWILPILISILVVGYELGPARWIEHLLGDRYRFAAEILIYGTLGPLLVFLLLDFVSRWLEERQTSDLQSQVLAQSNELARLSWQVSDDALQTLFATSILLSHLRASVAQDQPATAATLAEMERAIDQNIQQLRSHLLNLPAPAAPPPKAQPPAAGLPVSRREVQLTK